ncbi:MAG: FAD-dependent oxidoreductase [Pseudomonadales bacterium]
MSVDPEYQAAIVGGGLVGAVAALSLARRGWSVLLLERSRPVPADGRFLMDVRNVALAPASQALLAAVGVWAELQPAPYVRMEVWEERGTEAMSFSAAEVGRRELGWIVENGRALAALWRALDVEPGIRLVLGERLEAIEETAAGIRLCTDGGTYDARLLIGVDGARSTVRELSGTRLATFPTGHEALATLVRTESPHEGVALQRFLLDGPLALLPSREPSISSVVWSQSPDQAGRRLALPEPDFCTEIGRAIEHRLGAIEAVAERHTFPLAQQLVDDFNPTPRVLLLGDAARVVHPLAGLGANIGFEDVRELLDGVDTLPRGTDPGAAGLWRAFARQRRARARFMLRLMSGFKQVYAADSPAAQLLRNVGVGWLNRAAPLKQQFIREALGRL